MPWSAPGTAPEPWVHPRVLEESAAWTTRAFSGPGTVTEACCKVAFGESGRSGALLAPDRLAAEDDQEHAECQHRTLCLAPHWIQNSHRSIPEYYVGTAAIARVSPQSRGRLV